MSSNLVCKICNEPVLEDSHWWRNHHIKMANYFIEYYDKKSLLTNEPITFKSKEQYLLSDFNGKNELKSWLKNQSLERQREYLKEILIKRKELKSLIYIPTQVECRSYDCFPGIITFNNLFKDYYQLCQELGYQSRGFVNINEKTVLIKERELRGNPILCDTREQSVLNFNNKEINICTLPVGDYSIKNNNYDIYVERKSLNDLTSTFGPKNFDRFKNELIRAKNMGAYIVLLVENDINTVLGFDHSPFYSKHTQMTATYLFHQIRVLLQEFNNWQIAFCKSRTDMVDKIKWIFEMGKNIKTIDCQLAIDLGLLRDGI